MDTTRTRTMSFPSWSLTQAVPIPPRLPPPFVPPLQVALARYSNLCCRCLTPLWSRMEAEEKSASHWRGRGSATVPRPCRQSAQQPAVTADARRAARNYNRRADIWKDVRDHRESGLRGLFVSCTCGQQHGVTPAAHCGWRRGTSEIHLERVLAPQAVWMGSHRGLHLSVLRFTHRKLAG